MKYTASSFAAILVTTFRSLLWPERAFVAPEGSFPVAAHLKTHSPDIAEYDLFEPVFRGVVRLFAMVRTVSWGGEPESPEKSQTPAFPRRGLLRSLTDAIVSALRRGSIQVRLLFIVLTLVVLFLFESVSSLDRGVSTGRLDSRSTITVGADR